MARSDLTIIFQRVQGLVSQVNDLAPDERALFLDLLLPETEAKPKAKRKRAKSGKSTRATSLAQKIQGTVGGKCAFVAEGEDDPCGVGADNPIHDPNGGYAGFHEFVAAKAVGVGGD